MPAGCTLPALAVGPVLTYGVVGAAIVPFGALGIRWDGLTALAALAGAIALAWVIRHLLVRRIAATTDRGLRWPEPAVAAGVLLGALATAWRRGADAELAIRAQHVDAVWHANTIRWILDTGQASPTHMGELRNVETQAPLAYPSPSTRWQRCWPS